MTAKVIQLPVWADQAREHGEKTGKKHIITTSIEHKAVLEPVQFLAERGFTVTVVKPEADGAVTAVAIAGAVRPDTLLVSVMHVNNETGVIEPIEEIAAALAMHGFASVSMRRAKIVKMARVPVNWVPGRAEVAGLGRSQSPRPSQAGSRSQEPT